MKVWRSKEGGIQKLITCARSAKTDMPAWHFLNISCSGGILSSLQVRLFLKPKYDLEITKQVVQSQSHLCWRSLIYWFIDSVRFQNSEFRRIVHGLQFSTLAKIKP